MMPKLPLRFCLLAVLALLALGFTGGTGFTQSPEDEDPPLSAEEVRILLRKPVSVSFSDTPLKECVTQLCAEHEIPVIWEKTQLEENGISLDEPHPFTGEFTHVTVKAALDRVLKDKQLGWYCTDYGLVITTRDYATQHRTPRVYDVTDLLPETTELEIKVPLNQGGGDQPPDIHQKPATRDSEKPGAPNDAPKYGPGGLSTRPGSPLPAVPVRAQFGGGFSGGFSGGSGMELAQPYQHHGYYGVPSNPEEEAISGLLMSLQQALDDEETVWLDYDGEGGQLQLIKTPHAYLLVVSHNDYVHFRTEDLLNELIMMDEDRHQNPKGLGITPDKRADINRPGVRIVTRKAPARSRVPARATRSRR